MNTNIQKYLAFLMAVEYNSFTKAAQILNYSQSGISRMIRDLEEEWGVILLERGKSGVRLTSDGLKLLPHVRSICQDYQTLNHQVESLRGLDSGILRIGTFSSIATHWLPNIVLEFQKAYPNIDYEFLLGDYEEIEKWILDGRIDCGFIRIPACSELELIFLELDELCVILPEGHPLCGEEKISFQALNDVPFLLLEKDANTEISDLLKKYGSTPHIRLTTWDDYSIMNLVSQGFGISILPKLILKNPPYRLVIKSLEIPSYRKIALAVRDWKTSSLAVQKFRDYLSFRKAQMLKTPI